MRLYRNYLYTKGRDLWRLLPAGVNRLLVEERERSDRQAFYSCLELSTGKILFEDFQPGEKIWSGIEDIYKDIVYFHRYAKPDMPTHTGIIAYDINQRKIIWENDAFTFSFIADDKVYCFKTLFDGRSYYALDYLSGEVLEEKGSDYTLINSLSKGKQPPPAIAYYLFPDTYVHGSNALTDELVSIAKKENVIAGRIDILQKDDLFFASYHTVNDNGSLTNYFVSVDILKKSIILETVLNKEITAFIPDSYFFVNDLLLLLVEKEQLLVYLIAE